MKVDKLKIIEDVHENINNTNDTNLVLASDFTETISEAFKEEEGLAVRETDQESRENTAKILLGSVMVKKLLLKWKMTIKTLAQHKN